MTRKRSINKADCKRLAVEVREEIGLQPMEALDPWGLAGLYGIQVIAFGVLPVSSEIHQHFTVTRPDVFSGALLPIGNGAVIIENDSHSATRRRSTMGHELAHVVCEHEFGMSLVNEKGCRSADPAQEAEAAEIGAELLIPFDAAKRLARQNATDQEVALQFGVSVELARWRMNSTGARLIAVRQAAKYKRARGA